MLVAATAALGVSLCVGGFARASTDFNGDGRQDVAVGSYLEDLDSGELKEGVIHVLYGRRQMLTTRGSQLFSQATPRIREKAEEDDRLGAVLAGGDFNGDGRDDLALGVPNEILEQVEGFGHGVVQVLYGARRGLKARGNQLFHQDKPRIRDRVESSEFFGTAVAAGDFDGNGRDDLAIGASGESDGAGAVHVLYGARKHLRKRNSDYLTQDTPGIRGDGAEEGDGFGGELAAGDLDGDGRDELVIAAQSEDIGEGLRQGVIHVLAGARSGLTLRGDKQISENSPGMAGEGAETSDEFGARLAVGNFDGDRNEDLAVGAPGEDVPGSFADPEGFDGEGDAGAVSVLYGSRRGIRTRGSDYFAQGDRRMTGSERQASASFGGALAAGDLDRDGRDELAIGAFWDPNPGGQGRTGDGSVQVVFGRRSGLGFAASQHLTQLTPGIGGGPASLEDVFGSTLAIANLNGRGADELLIGEPQDLFDLEDGCGPGGLHVLYPNRHRNLLARGYQFFTQGSPGIPGDGAEPCDGFSVGLLAG